MSTDPSRKHPANAQVIFAEELGAMSKNNLRTFALIVSAHPYDGGDAWFRIRPQIMSFVSDEALNILRGSENGES